jgi:hypothetical protein
VSLVDITAASVLLQPGIVYYAKIQLTGAESTFGTASDVAEKFSSLGFTSITIWDPSNVPAVFPDRSAFPTGDTYWARGTYSGKAQTAGLPSELKRVWVDDPKSQPAPAPGGYTPPPDFVGPPEPGWNWPVAPSNSTPTPAPTPSAPEAPGVTVASATPKPNLLVGLAAVAVIALVLFEVTRRRG